MDFTPRLPTLTPLCSLAIQVGVPTVVGAPNGQRRCVPILGGEVTGERLAGRILPGGADHVLTRADGCSEIDARYVIETADGATIHVTDQGLRHGPAAVMKALGEGQPVDPADYYFRTRMRMETGAEAYLWLNGLLLIGSGARGPENVRVDVFAVG